MATANKQYHHNIDLVNSTITGLPQAVYDDEAVNKLQFDTALGLKQDTLSIAAGSSSLLELTGNELSVKNLLIANVLTSTEATIADYVAAEYTAGTEAQRGDTVILTGASPTLAFIHNGGSAGTVADFTQINTGAASEAAVRAALSGTGAISYNDTTGVISFVGDATDIELTGDYAYVDASSSWQYPAIGDTTENAIRKLDGSVRELVSDVNANASAINGKARKVVHSINLVANVDYVLAHTMATADFIIQVRDAFGKVVDIEMDTFTSTEVTLTSNTSITGATVICIG